ncbi:MAG: hypothetical protein K9W45_06945 [Candidatus Heimdallarchaeum aukensis]|uniref:B box-type domain-containing protein n=1 Tax=Candidatus Heimdallarchaeum aukensis TaxID=2876573 RepID=A0A9Y1BI11_9ARCH|nr:MAG: hypothetical protein K9W45_06945 [Candidatus Heimdallarchaeum aukensis]
MLVLSSCQYCGNKAQYYCTNCGKLLCSEHATEAHTVYYCKNCDLEVYEKQCHKCGNKTEFSRNDNVLLCEWCKTPTVVDGYAYHQQLPEKIFSSILRINKKIADLLYLTDRYHKLVDEILKVRYAKIKLFPEIEDDLSILRTKIDNLIKKLRIISDSLFLKINKKLQSLNYLRSPNLNNLEPAEELINYLDKNYESLGYSLHLKIEQIEEYFASIGKKVDFLNYQYTLLKIIYRLIPEVEGEELIAIIPRMWIKKSYKLPKRHVFVLTNKNIYLLREKGLFRTMLKLKEKIDLSNVRLVSESQTLLKGKVVKISTLLSQYSLFGRDIAISELSKYFSIYYEYFKYSTSDLTVINEFKYYNLSVKDLREAINKYLNNLRVSLLKKREIKREIMYKNSLVARRQQILQRLANIRRKIQEITQSRTGRYQSPKVFNNLLQRLMEEQSRLEKEIRINDAKIREIDELWGVFYDQVS